VRATGSDRLHPHAPIRPSGRTQLALGILVCGSLLAAGLWALRASPESHIGPYGLIQALSPWYYVVLAGLLLSTAWTFRIERFRSPLLSGHLIVLVVLVHGAPALVESAPRFATAWLHAGFTDYVASTGRFLPLVDARFSWPSFFAGSALVDRAAGVHAATALIRWWPVALNLLYLPLIFRLAYAFLRSDEKAWIATALFPLANWVGQDYYSPQSIAFLLYLTFVFLLVGPLGAHDLPLWRLYWRSRGQGRILRTRRPWIHGGPWLVQQSQAKLSALGFHLGILVLLMAAMATGHQLTPILATGSAMVFVLAGRTRVRWLVIAFALMTIVWVCYGAVSFWSGHFGLLVGQVGSVQNNVSSAFIARLHGSFAHRFVVDVRLVMSGLVWLLAVLGGLLWRSDGADRRALVISFLLPFGMLVGGSYGGEAVLRVYLFALPFAVCLVAALISRIRWSYRWMTVGVILALLVPFFLVSRWGNELFELVRPNEVSGVKALYRIARPGSTLISITPQLPWRFADVARFRYEPSNLDEFALESVPAIIRLVEGNPRGGYVIITTSQIDYGWQAYGLPSTWGTKVEKLLSDSAYFKIRYTNQSSQVFEYTPRPRSG
jgi:hypothetical protein